MKKLSLLWVLLWIAVISCTLAGCWKKEQASNVTKNEINVESCNTYFELVNCIIDNDTDASYSEEDRKVIREWVEDMRDGRASLDDETLDEMCIKEISKFEWEQMKEYLSNIGCSID